MVHKPKAKPKRPLIAVNVSTAEREAIRAAAAATERSVAQWVRLLIRRELERVKEAA